MRRQCIVRIALIVIAATYAMPRVAAAQATAATVSFPSGALPTDLAGPRPVAGTSRMTDVAFLASLVVPGSGQFVLKQNRWVPYAAVEAWAWLRYIDQRSTADRLSQRYKDLAWSIARRVSTGERRDTAFPYYELLIHYRASGAFDAQPSLEGIQPEFDPSTYNGEQWLLAQSLFIPEGEQGAPSAAAHEAALEYYREHAIPESYAFAWNTGRLEQQVYTNVISESDAAYRDATRMLGLILANHLTSAVDALISTRLRSAVPGLGFESGLVPGSPPAGRRPVQRQLPLRLDAQFRFTW